MSPWKRRPHADHRAAATQARSTAGEWVLVGTYASKYSAEAVAHCVRSGGGSVGRAYRATPAEGKFTTRCDAAGDGTQLWVRYEPLRSYRDFRESVDSGLTESFTDFCRRTDGDTSTPRR